MSLKIFATQPLQLIGIAQYATGPLAVLLGSPEVLPEGLVVVAWQTAAAAPVLWQF